MKTLTLIVFLIGSIASFAQTPITVKVSGNIFNTNRDSIFISNYFNNKYTDHLKGRLDKKGNYTLSGKLPYQDYYVIRIGNQHVNLILKEGSDLKFNADGKNIFAYYTLTGTGANESIAINEFVNELQIYNTKRDSSTAMIKRNPQNSEAINQSMQQIYYQFTSFRTSYIARNNNSPALLPVISTLDLNKEFATYESIVKQLTECFSGSPNVEIVKNEFIQNKKKMDAMNFLSSGKEAPNFTQNDVNGNPMSLTDLRGKIVLIDFWASWCGPCRKENPNVVALYKKYKDAGFTVMSVSLDKDKNSWLAAIEKDGLIWPNHVSDLKYWSNEVAKQYQVASIPFTVLIDREGKIIDTKLRGVELEQALKTIFGF